MNDFTDVGKTNPNKPNFKGKNGKKLAASATSQALNLNGFTHSRGDRA